MAEAIDLTLSDSEEEPLPSAEQRAEEEMEQRKRIMDFASNVAAAKKLRAPVKAEGNLQPVTLQNHMSEEAVDANTSRTPTDVDAAIPPASTTSGVNLQLKELHEARMRRQQQQQQESSSQPESVAPELQTGTEAAGAAVEAARSPAGQAAKAEAAASSSKDISLLTYNVW
jgi:ATP-dependent exoDNAse (exonuclease V) beta subunit